MTGGSPKKALKIAKAAALVLASSAVGCGTGYTFPGLDAPEMVDEARERRRNLPISDQCRAMDDGRVVLNADGGFGDCCFRYPESEQEVCCRDHGMIFVEAGCAVPGPFVPPEMA